MNPIDELANKLNEHQERYPLMYRLDKHSEALDMAWDILEWAQCYREIALSEIDANLGPKTKELCIRAIDHKASEKFHNERR